MAKEEIKVIPVIKAVCQIGDGSTERPHRTGIEYRDLDGKVLFITEAERSEYLKRFPENSRVDIVGAARYFEEE